MKLLRRLSVCFVFLGTAALADCQDDHVHLNGPWGSATFSTEIADEPAERQQGLMFRDVLPRSASMLFIFPEEAPRAFWMKNTLIPLDILYFDSDGEFVSVQENAIPGNLEALPSDGPAQFVLEIAGGLAKILNISSGTRLEHPRIKKDASNLHCTG